MKFTTTAILLMVSLASFAGPCDPGTGNDKTLCVNEPYGLWGSLTGDPDLTGQWYDYNDQACDQQIEAGELNIPGAYEYYYVISGGSCTKDTAFVRLTVVTCQSWGLAEEQENSNFSLYPNPTNDQLMIESKLGELMELQIFELDGKLIKTIDIIEPKSSIDVSSLKSGIYLVRLKLESGIEHQIRFTKE